MTLFFFFYLNLLFETKYKLKIISNGMNIRRNVVWDKFAWDFTGLKQCSLETEQIDTSSFQLSTTYLICMVPNVGFWRPLLCIRQIFEYFFFALNFPSLSRSLFLSFSSRSVKTLLQFDGCYVSFIEYYHLI